MTMQVAKKIEVSRSDGRLRRSPEAGTKPPPRSNRGKTKDRSSRPSASAGYMADLFTRVPDRVRVLDAGAGIGSLAAAFCERVLALPSPRRLEITLYESDLGSCCRSSKRTCGIAGRHLADAGHELCFSDPRRGFHPEQPWPARPADAVR